MRSEIVKSLWKIFCNTKTEEKAIILLNKFKKELKENIEEVITEPYHKGGYVVSFTVRINARSWNDTIVCVVECAQRVGYEWIISGDIMTDPEVWSNKSKISGITSISWMCINKG